MSSPYIYEVQLHRKFIYYIMVCFIPNVSAALKSGTINVGAVGCNSMYRVPIFVLQQVVNI